MNSDSKIPTNINNELNHYKWSTRTKNVFKNNNFTKISELLSYTPENY